MMDKRVLGMASMVSALGLLACDPGTADGPTPIGPDLNKEICHSDVNITGSMVADARPPLEPNENPPSEFDCWPAGVWTFSAKVAASNEDGTQMCPATNLRAEYKIKVTRDAALNETYDFLTEPAAKATASLKVSSGGGGLCTGVFEFYSADGKILHNLHPALQADLTLTGKGSYHEFAADQLER
jgi:hypothetical protein